MPEEVVGMVFVFLNTASMMEPGFLEMAKYLPAHSKW